MKLSFVIPAYNEEAYLGKCLKSIFKQLEGRTDQIEVIVVNNTSADKTKEVALSFPGVIVIDEPKKGIVHARKAGYQKARGELIANVDADTILTPHWIDKVLRAFVANPEMAAFSGPFIYYDLPILVKFWVKIFYYLGFFVYLINRHIFKLGMLQGGNFVIKKSAMDSVGGYNSEITFYGEDTDIARRISKAGEVVFTFKLPIYASGRRLEDEGILKTAFKYAVNYFSTIYFKKPLSKDYTDIRP